MAVPLDIILIPALLVIGLVAWRLHGWLSHDRDSDLTPSRHELDEARKLKHNKARHQPSHG